MAAQRKLTGALFPRRSHSDRPTPRGARVVTAVRVLRSGEITVRIEDPYGSIDETAELVLQGPARRSAGRPLRTLWSVRPPGAYAVAALPSDLRPSQKWLLAVRERGRVTPAVCSDSGVVDLTWFGTGDRADRPLADARIDRNGALMLSLLERPHRSCPHTVTFGIGTAEITWEGRDNVLVFSPASWSTSKSAVAFEAQPTGPLSRRAVVDLDSLPPIDAGEWVCFVGPSADNLTRLRADPGSSPRTDRSPHIVSTSYMRPDGTAVTARFRYTGTHQLCLHIRTIG